MPLIRTALNIDFSQERIPYTLCAFVLQIGPVFILIPSHPTWELKQLRRLQKKTIGLMIKTTPLHVHHAF